VFKNILWNGSFEKIKVAVFEKFNKINRNNRGNYAKKKIETTEP